MHGHGQIRGGNLRPTGTGQAVVGLVAFRPREKPKISHFHLQALGIALFR